MKPSPFGRGNWVNRCLDIVFTWWLLYHHVKVLISRLHSATSHPSRTDRRVPVYIRGSSDTGARLPGSDKSAGTRHCWHHTRHYLKCACKFFCRRQAIDTPSALLDFCKNPPVFVGSHSQKTSINFKQSYLCDWRRHAWRSCDVTVMFDMT